MVDSFVKLLRGIPHHFIMFAALLLVTLCYLRTVDTTFVQLMIAALSSLTTLLVTKPNQATVNADNVENVDNTNGTVTTNTVEPKKEENL